MAVVLYRHHLVPSWLTKVLLGAAALGVVAVCVIVVMAIIYLCMFALIGIAFLSAFIDFAR